MALYLKTTQSALIYSTYVCVYTHIHTCKTYIYIYTYMYICIYIYTHAHTHTYIYTNIYIHIHMYCTHMYYYNQHNDIKLLANTQKYHSVRGTKTKQTENIPEEKGEFSYLSCRSRNCHFFGLHL